MLDTAIANIDQLVLVGDLTLASQLLESVVAVSKDTMSPFASLAAGGVTKLVEGPMVRHMAMFLHKATDAEFAVAQKMSATIGPSLVRPMSDALEHLSDRLGLEEARSFATLIQQSEELGSSITDALRVYSDDMRHKRL